MALEGIAVAFTPGVPPIWTHLVRYYDAAFKNRNRWFLAAVRRFLIAVCFVAVTGAFAAIVSAAINQKYEIVQLPATPSAVWPAK